METITRICTKCRHEKPLDQFHKDCKGKLGHSSQCSECRLKVCRDRRAGRKPEVSTTHKICKGCGKNRSLTSYRKCKDVKSGLTSRCRYCLSERDLKRRAIADEKSPKKVCKCCNVSKPLTKFPTMSQLYGGRSRQCLSCRDKERRLKDRINKLVAAGAFCLLRKPQKDTAINRMREFVNVKFKHERNEPPGSSGSSFQDEARKSDYRPEHCHHV